jgi:glutamate---cysteine ligase / carboxylate-amine ligase
VLLNDAERNPEGIPAGKPPQVRHPAHAIRPDLPAQAST